MIGIIIGIITGFNYLGASWSNNTAYWAGTGGGMLVMILLGIILFPKTIARIISVTLWFAPLAIIISILHDFANHSFPVDTVWAIIYAIANVIALAVVKSIRGRAREVNL